MHHADLWDMLRYHSRLCIEYSMFFSLMAGKVGMCPDCSVRPDCMMMTIMIIMMMIIIMYPRQPHGLVLGRSD